jgi:DNA-binding LacI/PurR family transcriptional regulator
MGRTSQGSADNKRVTLRTIAERLQLTPATISVVLNGRPAATAIPQHTKERIRQAAEELNYRPNYFARSLSLKTSRTYVVALLVSGIVSSATAEAVAAVEKILREQGYLMFVGLCEGYASERYLAQLAGHGVEGIITLDVQANYYGALPIVEMNQDATFLHGLDRRKPTTQIQLAAETAVLSLLESVKAGGKPKAPRNKARAPQWGFPTTVIAAGGNPEGRTLPE